MFVLYPENAPKDWRTVLQMTGLPCMISPLHDKDISSTGKPEKAHYHIVVFYSSPTSYNVAKLITDKLRQPAPQAIYYMEGCYQLLTQRDGPSEAYYNDADIVIMNRFNIFDYIKSAELEA